MGDVYWYETVTLTSHTHITNYIDIILLSTHLYIAAVYLYVKFEDQNLNSIKIIITVRKLDR